MNSLIRLFVSRSNDIEYIIKCNQNISSSEFALLLNQKFKDVFPNKTIKTIKFSKIDGEIQVSSLSDLSNDDHITVFYDDDECEKNDIVKSK